MREILELLGKQFPRLPLGPVARALGVLVLLQRWESEWIQVVIDAWRGCYENGNTPHLRRWQDVVWDSFVKQLVLDAVLPSAQWRWEDFQERMAHCLGLKRDGRWLPVSTIDRRLNLKGYLVARSASESFCLDSWWSDRLLSWMFDGDILGEGKEGTGTINLLAIQERHRLFDRRV